MEARGPPLRRRVGHAQCHINNAPQNERNASWSKRGPFNELDHLGKVSSFIQRSFHTQFIISIAFLKLSLSRKIRDLFSFRVATGAEEFPHKASKPEVYLRQKATGSEGIAGPCPEVQVGATARFELLREWPTVRR